MDESEKLSEEELLEEIKGLHQKLFDNLPTKVTCKSVTAPTKKRIPFKACLVKTALIYRIVDITGIAIDLFEKKKLLPAYILARCVTETAALLFSLYKRLEQVVETCGLGDIDNFLNKTSIGGRSDFIPKAPDGSVIEANNILTAIDKLDKEYKGLRQEYEFICEFAHPNFLGNLGSYGQLDKENNCYYFSFDKPYKTLPDPEAYGLTTLSVSLLIFTVYYKKTEDILPLFTEICEK